MGNIKIAQKYPYCVPIKYDCIRRAAEGTAYKNENNVSTIYGFFDSFPSKSDHEKTMYYEKVDIMLRDSVKWMNL